MRKNELEQNLRDYVTNSINPNQRELNFVRKIYKSIKEVLGEGNCYRIGSWPRGTAIHPLHDLDILFVAARNFDINNPPDPSTIISEIITEIVNNLEIPNELHIETEMQSHSCAIIFKDSDENVQFSVDIVPGYVDSNNPNEQGQDTYFIPDISYLSRIEKSLYYKNVKEEEKVLGWKRSDPRGYIKPTRELYKRNKDFRLAVKFIKAWKQSAKKFNGDDFKLKSFHLEQRLFQYYSEFPNHTIFDGIFYILYQISSNSPFFNPSILDRGEGNQDPYIDSYLNDLTLEQKQLITNARDYSLISIENIINITDINHKILSGEVYKRPISEEFLFDRRIKTFTENLRDFQIKGKVLPTDLEPSYFLHNQKDKVKKGRKIDFKVSNSFFPDGGKIFWKVKNDYDGDPRGEINPGKTLNNPEPTTYIGNHYVEAYLILNGECIEKYRQPVIIEE